MRGAWSRMVPARVGGAVVAAALAAALLAPRPAMAVGNSCVPNHCRDGGDTGIGAVCHVSGATYTCSCDPGYAFTGVTCANFNACTSTATGACQTSQRGNSCVDEAPPSPAYHCTCGATGYSGTNTTQCQAVNPCARNPCLNGGDPGAVCRASGATYTCSCDAGYSFIGGTCLKPR